MDEPAVVENTLRVSRPAHPAQLGQIRSRVQRWGEHHHLPEGVLIDLQLAVGEAVANGVEHAYADMATGTVEVEIRLRRTRPGADDGVLLVRVTDNGRWRPPRPSAGHRGRGMLVIERLAQRTEIVRGRSGTRVCFEIAFRDAG